MKLLLSLMVAGATVLFAGGDILPIKVYKPAVQQKQSGCYKPNIKKCPDCTEVAELCPDDPNLPLAQTEPCQALLNR